MVISRPMIVNYSILKISELYWHFSLFENILETIAGAEGQKGCNS